MNDKQDKPHYIAKGLIGIGFCIGAWKLIEINFPGSVSNTVVDHSVFSFEIKNGEEATLSPESKAKLDETERHLNSMDRWLKEN